MCLFRGYVVSVWLWHFLVILAYDLVRNIYNISIVHIYAFIVFVLVEFCISLQTVLIQVCKTLRELSEEDLQSS